VWSALAATLVGSDNVHVFEPNLASWFHIRRIFSFNNLSCPKGIFPGFVSNSDLNNEDLLMIAHSKTWIQEQPGQLTFESLQYPGDIPQIKLDSYCNKFNVTPDVIKIDVEGAEGEVLRGSRYILETSKPLIFLSLHPTLVPLFGDSKEDLLVFIKQFGYECVLLAEDHEEHWMCSIN